MNFSFQATKTAIASLASAATMLIGMLFHNANQAEKAVTCVPPVASVERKG